MKFEILHDNRLPPLAWLLLHERGDASARVFAGAGVRTTENAFWEGVNPSFRHPELTPEHHFPLCTGCVTRDDDIVAFTPGHIFDRLFLIRRDRRLFLSNSLPFALRAADTQLEPRDLLLHWRFGVIQAHRQSAGLRQGRLEFFHNTNIVIGPTHEVRCELKPPSPDFDNFADYQREMNAYLDEISDALRDKNGIRYEPVSTISSGYDSAAAAVLAKSIGATRTLTISDSRYGEADDDSGAVIAERLGMSVSIYKRDDYRQDGFEAERLFYMCGIPEDINFHSFRDEIRRTLLFTGHKGDTMWGINSRPVGSWSLDPGGVTMQCFRLRTDFVHFPPAFFGWARHDKVISISRSEEMRPWSVGGSYDRPIPRRIIEEAGVPREWFGIKKRAVSVMYGLDKRAYVAPGELGISQELATLLRQHRQRWRTPVLDLAMACGNAAHQAMRRISAVLDRNGDSERRSDRSSADSLKSRLTAAMARAGNLHRAFWIPFTDLCFAPQVTSEILARDYPAPDILRKTAKSEGEA